MVNVSYKRTSVLLKIAVCLLFYGVAGFILYAILNWDLSVVRQIFGYLAILLAVIYFGKFFVVLTVYFFKKDTTLFSYDDKYLYLANEKYEISNIKRFAVPEKKKGMISSPTFLFYLENQQEPISIPTNYLFLDKELDECIKKMKKDLGFKGREWTGKRSV